MARQPADVADQGGDAHCIAKWEQRIVLFAWPRTSEDIPAYLDAP